MPCLGPVFESPGLRGGIDSLQKEVGAARVLKKSFFSLITVVENPSNSNFAPRTLVCGSHLKLRGVSVAEEEEAKLRNQKPSVWGHGKHYLTSAKLF